MQFFPLDMFLFYLYIKKIIISFFFSLSTTFVFLFFLVISLLFTFIAINDVLYFPFSRTGNFSQAYNS